MVEKFNCYVHTPATRATCREIRQDGEFVLASDYAKLEARIAAANATLDRLSEVFGTDKPLPFCNNCDSYQAEWQDDECISCGGNLDTSSLMLCDIYAILNPEENDK